MAISIILPETLCATHPVSHILRQDDQSIEYMREVFEVREDCIHSFPTRSIFLFNVIPNEPQNLLYQGKTFQELAKLFGGIMSKDVAFLIKIEGQFC